MNLCVLRRLTSIRVYISDKPGALRPSLVNLSGKPANTHTVPSGDLIHACRQFGPVFLVPLRGIFKYGSTLWNECKDLIQTKQASKQTCLFSQREACFGHISRISQHSMYSWAKALPQLANHLIIFPRSQCHSISKTLSAEPAVNALG